MLGAIELDFDSDTLCLIRFINLLEKKGADLNKLFATIIGRNIKDGTIYDKEHPLRGRISYSILDGYIRSLAICDVKNNKNKLEVGGSNATKEDIAANKISIIIPQEYYYKYHMPHLPFYLKKSKATLKELRYAYEKDQIDTAIALARRIPKKLSYQVLSHYLEKPLNNERMEFVCEGFRYLGVLYEKDDNIAISSFNNLRAFVETFSQQNMYNKSIVYALESLGYILRSNKNVALVSTLDGSRVTILKPLFFKDCEVLAYISPLGSVVSIEHFERALSKILGMM